MLNSIIDVIKLMPKDLQTHTGNVAYLSRKLSQEIELSKQQMFMVWLGGLIHDIGKIYVDQSIIYKNGKLTDKEYGQIKKHCQYGEQILLGYNKLVSLIPLVKYHHERWDGNGYYGLSKDEIPLEARIVCIADCFDAMVSKRSYKEKMSIEHAKEELIRCSGTQFDPYLVEPFINCLEKLYLPTNDDNCYHISNRSRNCRVLKCRGCL